MKSKKIYPKKSSAGDAKSKSGASKRVGSTSTSFGRRKAALDKTEGSDPKRKDSKKDAKEPTYQGRKSTTAKSTEGISRGSNQSSNPKGEKVQSDHPSTPYRLRRNTKLDPKDSFNRKQKEERLKRETSLQDNTKDSSVSSRKPASKPQRTTKNKNVKSTKPDAHTPSRSHGFEVLDPKIKLSKSPVEDSGALEEKKPVPTRRNKEGAHEEMRLNKYIAHCGIASRRAADTLIMQGHVTVNGVIVQEMGYKVLANDMVAFKGKPVKAEEKMVYYLLNKPTNVLTTSSDERGRRTVIDIMSEKIPERIYPVGRLDRNTSGLIILTNDGELTKKLSHPSYKVPKVYLVTLDKNLSLKDMEQIRDGITLEDGPIKADSLHFVEGLGKREVQIEVHSGKNRLVRRIFEHFGYEVVKLDRTYYAGLTKKNLPRGMFRPLTKEEVRMLKHFT